MFSKQKSSDLAYMKEKMSEMEFFIEHPEFVFPLVLIVTFLIAPVISIVAVIKDLIRLFSNPGRP